MKPANELTDQELNEAIASILEEKPQLSLSQEAITDCSDLGYWIFKPFEELGKWEPVNFCNSWQYAGQLLEEIIDAMNLTVITIFKDEIDHHEAEAYFDNEYQIIRCAWHKSDCKPRKIAEAFYTMKGGVE